MMKKLGMLSAFATLFSLTPMQAQTLNCSLSDSESGLDSGSTTASVSDFSCIDTVANAFVMDMTIDVSMGSWCPNWYDFEIKVNGNSVAQNLCGGTYDLSDYVENLNGITEVSVVSEDNDNYSDNITMNLDVDISYIITDCPPPADLEITSVTSSSAMFSWTPNGTEVLWDVELVDITAGDTATGTPTTYGVITDSLALTSLAADNMYEIYVRANCVTGIDIESMWVGPIAFTTEPTCYPVSGVQVTDIIDVAATAFWTSDEDEWEIELIDVTAGDAFIGTPTVLSLVDTSYSFSALTPENDYAFKVRSNCGPVDGNSLWSTAVYFTTDPSCLAPVDVVMTSLTDSSVSISWTSSDDETQWGIEIINVDNGEVADLTSDYTSADTTYVINGLDPNTTYQIFVSAECSASDISDWTEMDEFTTLCVASSIPYIDSLNVWPSDCYTLSNSGTSSNWQVYTGSTGVIEANFWNFSSGTVTFQTGEIEISQQAKFEFVWSSGSSTFYDDQVIISYSDDGGVTWNELWNESGTQLASNDGAFSTSPGSFITTQILLPVSTVGQNIALKFDGISDYGPDFFLDEIRVLPLPDCNVAYNVEVDTVTSTDVTVSFTDIVGDNSVSWDYLVISGTDTTSGNTTSNPFSVTGLIPGTNYTVEMSTLCTSDTTEYTTGVGFQTVCAPVSYYTQDFQSYNGGDLPLCWEELEDATSTFADVEVYAFSGYNSSQSFQFYNSSSTGSSTHLIALTPELLNVNDNWLRFFHRTTSTGAQKLAIGYMTDMTDGDTFVGLDTVDLVQNSWNETTFIPSDYASFPADRIAIKGLFDGTYRYLYIDDIVWEEIPSCYFPNDVTIDSTTLDAVYANIDPYNATDAVWEIEIVNLTTGETFTGTPTDTVTTSIFFIDGLDHSSQYEMYVRTDCGTETSIWGPAYSFSTQCAAVTDFVQDYEVGTTCWTLNNIATSTFAQNQVVTFTPNSGSQANYLYNSSSGNPSSTFIATVTPELSNIASGTHWIKFQARRRYTWSSTGNLELGTMSDPTDPSTYTQLTTFNLTNSYQEYHYSFVGYTGTDSYIAIRLLIDGTYRYVMLDDVVWEPVPECATPENVHGVDIQDITAEIDWNPISIDSAWYMEIVDITNGGAVTGVATDSTTTRPYTFTGLTQNTTYAVYVQADCDTNWSVPYLFTTLISNDIEVTNFVSPISQGCMLTSAEEVVITITNNGAQDATGFDVSYSFDGVNYTSDGVFSGTLAANSDTAYTLNTTFDFTVANDTNLFVAVDLLSDTISVDNDTNSYFITNLGNQLMQLQVTAGQYAGEHIWYVIDTLSGNTVAEHASFNPVGGEYSNYQTYNHDICVFVGNTYSIEAWDSYGDGWNGGVYELTQCGGVFVANNGGLSPTTPPNSFQSGGQLEAQEYFTVEECDDYDLAIVMMDSIYSACDMSATEQGYLLVQNFGLMDITSAMNVSVEYQVNGSGWANLATLTNFASGADSLLALPTVDMTTPLTYTFEFQVIYALDENPLNDSLELEIESVDTYMEVTQDFDDAPSGWTGHISQGSTNSWEWGVPTTPLIGNGVDGSAWVTVLDANMFLNEESYLLSPCFDFSGYTEDAELSFDFIWTTPFSNTVRFQVSTDGGATWPSLFGAGWDNVTMPANTLQWTGYIALIDLAGESDVKFRFFMDNGFSTDAEGFGMDNFQVFEHVPYTDTTLVDLTVDGVTIPGFDPAVFDYTYEVLYGTATAPLVGATVNAPFYESMVITQSPTIPGTATVVVTAEDTNFTATYTVNFTEAPASTNAYLSDISEGGVTINGFDSLIFTYYDTLPYGTTTVPTVTSDVADPTATSSQTNPGSLPGAVVIVVTAQDGSTTNTYTINYALADPDTVSALSDLTVGGPTVAGFHPDTLNYTVPVAAWPTTVGYTAESSLSTVDVSPAGPYNAAALVTITVTAQDGSTTTVYTVNLTAPLSSDAGLTDLSYEDGGTYVTVSGFNTDTLEYTVELPFGDPIPNVDYETSDTTATVDVTTSGPTAPGTTTITVTAADGTVQVYVINWTQAAASSNNLLATLVFGSGTGIEGELLHESNPTVVTFDPLVNVYRWVVTEAIYASVITPLAATAQDPTATVDIELPLIWGDPYKVYVTAENGDINTYIINSVNAVGQTELEAGSVSMYPNPSTGIVNVEVVEDITDYSIEVISTTGQKVFFSEYENGNAQLTLDLSSVADGMYYVILKDTQSGKFTKEKISIIK